MGGARRNNEHKKREDKQHVHRSTHETKKELLSFANQTATSESESWNCRGRENRIGSITSFALINARKVGHRSLNSNVNDAGAGPPPQGVAAPSVGGRRSRRLL